MRFRDTLHIVEHHCEEQQWWEVIYKEGEGFYTARSPTSASIDAVHSERRRIPLNVVQKPLPDDLLDILIAPLRPPRGFRFEYIDLSCYSWEDGQVHGPNPGEILIDEIRAYESLRRHHHRNLEQYMGCVLHEDMPLGYCVKKYQWTLKEAVENGVLINPDVVIDDCLDAIKHLHSLGLAHNNISPSTIMIDEFGRGVIVDFTSCRKEGTAIPACSFNTSEMVSNKTNDLCALEKCVCWLLDYTASILEMAGVPFLYKIFTPMDVSLA